LPSCAGFLRFDPAKLQFMSVSEVQLKPEAAAVGLEIRVVGNDSGEKVIINCTTHVSLFNDSTCNQGNLSEHLSTHIMLGADLYPRWHIGSS
jgi:hypothetical protein